MSRRPRTSAPTVRARRGRTALAAVAGAACAAALAIGPAAAAAGAGTDAQPDLIKKLKGTVGPGFEISINKSTVAAGKYKLIVQDQGTIHNFHITGPGVDKATTILGTGKTVFKIKLKAGTYDIVCDAHAATMFTTLTVT